MSLLSVPSTRVRRKRWARCAVVAGVSGIGLVLGTGIASAHVTVSPASATAGTYTVLTFKVPNESATAKTVSLTIDLPTDHPFASVSVHKQPGWTSTTTIETLKNPITNDDGLKIAQAVNSITLKADASSQLSLGEFAEFDIQVGPVPDGVSSLSFPATQNYSDGTVVKWNEPTPASGAEPDHPVPTVKIVAAGDTGPATSAVASSAVAGPTVTATQAAAASGSGSSTDGTARVLSVIAIVLAAFALLAGALAFRRRA